MAEPRWLGHEAFSIHKRMLEGPSEFEGLLVYGRIKVGKQQPRMSVNQKFLEFLRSRSLFHDLNLTHYFKESVGNTYSKTLYCPAIINANLLWPKFRKYAYKERNIDNEAWEEALRWTYLHYSKIPEVTIVHDMDLQKTLLSSSDLDGSCGVVYSRFSPSKKHFILKKMTAYFKAREFFKYCPVSFWKGFCKEELREGEKVLDSPSTRMIWGEDVIHFIAAFQLFYELQEKFIQLREHFWSSAGLDFAGSEYGMRMSRFTGRSVCSIDGSGFDANMQESDILDLHVLWDTFFINKDELYYDLLTFVMSNDVYSTVVMGDGRIVRKEAGNPSGSYLTLMRNTFHNYRLYAYVYITSSKNSGYEYSYEQYTSDHEALMNGDDCIITKSLNMTWPIVQKYMSTFLDLTIDSEEESSIFDVFYCGCKAVETQGQIVPLRNSYKLLLSLLFLNKEETEREKILGLINANPFDDFFIQILREYSSSRNYAIIPIQAIRNRFFYKEVREPSKINFGNDDSQKTKPSSWSSS